MFTLTVRIQFLFYTLLFNSNYIYNPGARDPSAANVFLFADHQRVVVTSSTVHNVHVAPGRAGFERRDLLVPPAARALKHTNAHFLKTRAHSDLDGTPPVIARAHPLRIRLWRQTTVPQHPIPNRSAPYGCECGRRERVWFAGLLKKNWYKIKNTPELGWEATKAAMSKRNLLAPPG